MQVLETKAVREYTVTLVQATEAIQKYVTKYVVCDLKTENRMNVLSDYINKICKNLLEIGANLI